MSERRERTTSGERTRSVAVRRASAVVLAATAAAVAAGSCGVPRDSGFAPLGTDETFGANPVVPASSDPATTVGGSVTITTARSTGPRPSTTLVVTEDVRVYLVDGEELTAVTRTLARPASPLQMVLALERGPEPDEGAGTTLRSLVPDGLVREVETVGGVALVDLDAEVLRQIDSSDQRFAIAQLVLTLGIRPGIGQVSFSADGDPIAVPVPSRGDLLSTPGEAVSFDDFEPLIATDTADPPTTLAATPSSPPPPASSTTST